MSVLDRAKIKTSLMIGNRFAFACTRTPTVQHFCTKASIPGISSPSPVIENPFVPLPSPGDKITYDSLSIDFLIDEEMRAWSEIHDWMRALYFPTTYEEYKKLPEIPNKKFITREKFPQFSDIYVTVLSATNQAILRYTFVDAFPYFLSPIDLDTKLTPENTVTCNALFRYSYYNVHRIGEDC